MKPIRILHVLGSMNRGGVETWLMHIMRHLDHERFKMDFLVHTNAPAAHDAEVRSLGGRILSCPSTHNPIQYARRFLEITKEFGPFDVLHSHVHHFSGYVVWLGSVAQIPIRISHSHNDTSVLAAVATRRRRAYLSLSRSLQNRYSTGGLAASEPAALALFGPRWKRDRRVKVLYYGVDLTPYSLPVDRAAVRSDFGFREGNIVFGHVGRFDPQKNHSFLADIAAEIAKREPEARFLLVGDGPLRPSIESQFQRAGIGDRAVFAGSRPDVPRLMVGAMDAFLFPSVHEGLPLVLIEAQAASLPTIISDSIAAEATIIPGLVMTRSLGQAASYWAESALQHCQLHPPSALAEIGESTFNITSSLEALTHVYCAE
jgi:glycosyltransferase involved in cell wall biosynthesis